NHVGLRGAGTRKIYDRSPAGLGHVWKDFARREKGTKQVVIDLRVPVVQAVLDRRFVACKSACEIDKYIDALEFVHDVCNQAARLYFVSQGYGQRQYPGAALPEFGSARINIALRARANSERRALCRERIGDGLSDLARMAHAGDERNSSFKTLGHRDPPFSACLVVRLWQWGTTSSVIFSASKLIVRSKGDMDDFAFHAGHACNALQQAHSLDDHLFVC